MPWLGGCITRVCACALFRMSQLEHADSTKPAADLFKEAFKRYKKKDADLNGVIDVTTPQQYEKECLIHLHRPVTSESDRDALELGLTPPGQWKIYSLASIPGLMVIPNPFLGGCQHRWVQRCVVDYPRKPNICNLDAHTMREGEGQLWPEGDRGGALQLGKDDLLYKLRWVTLGYHYDWDTKEYYGDRRSPFPDDLSKLSSFVLKVAGFPEFSPEAAIVNFYHLDSTLSGHTDHSERDLSLPLLSISFGQSAVFLIGGETKSVRPCAILLRSGDVVIMSGPSRTFYHGIPKIISPSGSSPVPSALSGDALLGRMQRSAPTQEDGSIGSVCWVCGRERHSSSTEDRGEGESCVNCDKMARQWPDFEQYLSISRINVNIRQVNSHL